MKTIQNIIDGYEHSGYSEMENAYTYDQMEDAITKYALQVVDRCIEVASDGEQLVPFNLVEKLQKIKTEIV